MAQTFERNYHFLSSNSPS